jgi:hypothetical protein
MDLGTWVGIIIGIVVTAAFSVWAINDAREQVRRSVLLERNLTYLKLQNDLAWEILDPTDRGYRQEIANGLEAFVLLSRALDPDKSGDALREAAEKEALELADRLVADGFATWKPEMDREKLLTVMHQWKAQKSAVRAHQILEPQPKKPPIVRAWEFLRGK